MALTYTVIMAGGAGTRFWPLSRAQRPKQLLPLGGGSESLLRATVRRMTAFSPPERTLIVTSAALADATAAELPELTRANILAEPIGRNTAACIGWASAHVRRRDPEGVLAVLPADHHIGDEAGYARVISTALAAARGDSLVTVGITPTRPETGYGYIERGEDLGAGVFAVKRFVEKPDRDKAEGFLAAGNFLWNSGMFFFRAQAMLDALGAHLPDIREALVSYDDAAAQGKEAEVVARTYPGLQSISIDHGVMEKARDVRVVPGSFDWSDVGSWTTAWELAAKDAQGNAKVEDVVFVDSQNSYVHAPKGKAIALVGVRDLVVVDTGDALLIVPKERAQDVRDAVLALKNAARTDVL